MPHKFFDRTPYICAAGKKAEENCLTNELKFYPDYEFADHYIKSDKREKKCQKVIDSGLIPNIPPKINTVTAQELIEANLNKFRFKEFEENFYEDLYYQSAKMGRTGLPARIGSKPDYVTNTSRTFGKALESCGPAYEVIFPRKTPVEVKKEEEFFHDKYILSHNSYFPSERIQRYPKDIFDPTGKSFGIYNNVDISGKKVKNALIDCSIGETVILNTIQDDYIKKSKYQLGKAIKKQGFNHPEGTSYGSDAVKDLYTLSCLIQNAPPCSEVTSLLEAISYVSNLRIKLKNKVGFNFTAVKITLHTFDPDNSLYLDWGLVLTVLSTFHLFVNKEKIQLVANYFKIVNDDDKVNYVELLKFLDCGISLPELGNLVNLPPTNPDLCTTYREFASDGKRDTTCYPTKISAGVIRKLKPMIPSGSGCTADMSSLCDETDVKTCLSPSVPCQFGLSHRDYLLPRGKDEIRRIFRNCLKNISEEKFNKLYDEALHLHTSTGDKASVEAFKCCLIKYRKIQAIKVITL